MISANFKNDLPDEATNIVYVRSDPMLAFHFSFSWASAIITKKISRTRSELK